MGSRCQIEAIKSRISLWLLAIFYDVVFIDPLLIKTRPSSIPGILILIAVGLVSVLTTRLEVIVTVITIISYIYILFTSKREAPISIDVGFTVATIAKIIQKDRKNLILIPVEKFDYVKSLIELLIIEGDKAIIKAEEASILLSAAYNLWLEAARKRRLLFIKWLRFLSVPS